MINYTAPSDKNVTGDMHETLCGCCSDCGSFMYATCCLPCADAKAWSGARGENCSVCHMCFPGSAIWTRANLLRARGSNETRFCSSCTTYCCFPCCFTAQNLREIKSLLDTQDDASP